MFPVCFQALKCLITNIIVIGGPAVYFLQKGKYLSGYPQELLICFFSFHVLSLFIYLSLVSDADGCKAIKLVIELLSSRKRRGASLATCHFLRSSHESGVSIGRFCSAADVDQREEDQEYKLLCMFGVDFKKQWQTALQFQ